MFILRTLALLLVSGLAFADLNPILPITEATTTISVTNSSAATALPRGDVERRQIELQNAGAQTVFVRFCNSSTCTATTTLSYPVLSGQSKVVTVPPDTSHIAALTASSTSTLYVTIGTGN